MADLTQLIGAAIKGAQLAGPTARLAAAARGALVEGDPAARAYLASQGWKDALELAQPGLGEAASALLWHAGRARREVAEAVGAAPPDGVRVAVERYPWDAAFAYLHRVRWGSFAILGPRGEGKTTLALRLAERWRERLGYPVEAVGMYVEDRPDWVTGVLPEEIVRRAERLRAAVNAVDTAGSVPDPIEAGLVAAAERRRRGRRPAAGAPRLTLEQAERLLAGYAGRILIVDEVGLNLGRGALTPLRLALLDLFNQARHLGWLVVYCAQSSRQIPPELLNGQGVFVKRPLGSEVGTDRERGPTRDLWIEATAAFETLHQQPLWSEVPDPRAWAWLSIADLGGGRRAWTGLAPFRPVGWVEEPVEEGPTVIEG